MKNHGVRKAHEFNLLPQAIPQFCILHFAFYIPKKNIFTKGESLWN